MIAGDGWNVSRGAGSQSPSRNTGQGVYCCGELKGLNPKAERKRQVRSLQGTPSERAGSHSSKTRNRTIYP